MKISLRNKVQIKRKKLLFWSFIFFLPVYFFTPIAFIQFLCIFFLFIILFSRIYTEYLVRNIFITRKDSELRVFRHEWVRVEIKVENRGILPAFMLVSGDLSGEIQVIKMKKTFCTLFHNTWTMLCWDGLCADRGVFSAGPALIRGADPLGIFPFHLTNKETTKIYVYPAVRSINLKKRMGIPLGNIVSINPIFEDITRCRSLRPYYHGDERRRINWKASAHVSYGAQSSGLLVNEYEATASYPLMIFLNVNQNEYRGRNKRELIERTIEAAAALCLMTFRERQSLGIIIYNLNQKDGLCFITPSSNNLIPILERLAALNWSKSSKNAQPCGSAQQNQYAHNSLLTMINCGRFLPYGTRYLYAGPDLGDEAYITLNLLKKYHLSLEYLIIDDRALPSVVPGNSPCYQMKETGYEIV